MCMWAGRGEAPQLIVHLKVILEERWARRQVDRSATARALQFPDRARSDLPRASRDEVDVFAAAAVEVRQEHTTVSVWCGERRGHRGSGLGADLC